VSLWAIGLVVLGVTMSAYVGFGVLHDRRAARVERKAARARRALALVLFEDEATASRVFGDLLAVPRSLLLDIMQNVAVDLGGAAYDRLRAVVLDAHLARRIRSLGKRRAWRKRVQAAHLQHLLPDDDPRRMRLLHDPHPLVRARAAECMQRDDVVAHVETLVMLLDDPVRVVRVGAQQALLRGDARIAEALCEYLWSGARTGTSIALEVAASLPDPRYGPVIVHHASDPDPQRRAMVARALGSGATLESLDTLKNLLADDDANVRAAAASAIAALHATELVTHLGVMLADPSWSVRRAAGRSLSALGASGRLVLRAHLFDSDRYARDMARQTLDAAAARDRQPPVQIPEALPALETWIPQRGVA
jgi:HEAT repeat protein